MSTKTTRIEGEIIEIPETVAAEINDRTVRSMEANANHAKTLHERGEEFALSNTVDVAVKAYLLHQMENDFSPSEAIVCYSMLVDKIILPSFASIPYVRDKIVKTERPDKDSNMLGEINAMLKSEGMEEIVVGGTIEEIIEKLRGMMESENETKQ